ncbi:MAG: hypothetical protein G01um101433_386 [Parcubacteria group bacterium Gr01-1014_33]|nr:MAG: hypothetical protein G01um101433_386 [Parcubacteria group bacterium Gr01-1014_33]
MAKICITSRPKGEAPDWVRDAWIGCEITIIPVTEDAHADKPQFHRVLSKKRSDMDGYIVDAQLAFGKLLEKRSEKSSDAYQWWMKNGKFVDQLLFDKECCEIIL